MDNKYAETYRKGKGVNELTAGQLIALGEMLAVNMLYWGTGEEYEPWEWESEELPYFITKAEELGLIRKRKSHRVTIEKVVYDED